MLIPAVKFISALCQRGLLARPLLFTEMIEHINLYQRTIDLVEINQKWPSNADFLA